MISDSMEQLIRVVGKTGFITKTQWEQFFFTGGNIRWRNKLWARLLASGFFKPYSYNFKEPTLVLNPKNKLVRAILQGRMVFAPNSKNFQHDQILCQGLFQLLKHPKLYHWQTESELKLFSPADYRIETQGQLIKFPDLILSVQDSSGIKTVSFELERTQKSKKRYTQIFNAYASMKGSDAVVCAVESPTIMRSIESALETIYFPIQEKPVLFMSENEWVLKPDNIFRKITGPEEAHCGPQTENA